jgi:hypothetical protein
LNARRFGLLYLALALNARIKELGIGQNEAARRAQAGSGNFSRICGGHAKPGRKVSASISREFGVEPELFDVEADVEASKLDQREPGAAE